MTTEELIHHDYRQAGAYRILSLLANSPEFPPEVQQQIRLEGMRLVLTPDFEEKAA